MNPARRGATAVYSLFFLSGISGLIYETVWLRMLTRILGSTVRATSVTLAAYMAGLALGSLLLGRIADRAQRPLRTYAWLEMGVAGAALAMLAALPALGPVARALAGVAHGSRGVLTGAQAIILFLVLLVPTFLMGGTLPVLAAHTRAHSEGLARRLGLLYGCNTLGAVAGVLLSGLFTLGWAGETATLLIGVALNLTVALMALRMAAPVDVPAVQPETAAAAPMPHGRTWLLWIYGASGFVAVAYEVVWTRVFQIQLGTSIYAFSMMLAFYLVGIAAGSLAGSWFLDRVRRPLVGFGLAQAFIALYGALGMVLFTRFEPLGNVPALLLHNLLTMPPLLVTPMTFALGFSFPAMSAAYLEDGVEVGRGVGRLYAVNTLGCILGSLAAGFVLLGWLGSRGTLIALASLNLLLGWIVLARRSGRVPLLAAAAATVGCLALFRVAPDPYLDAVRKSLDWMVGENRQVRASYNRETAEATTTAFVLGGDHPKELLWVNGVGMTERCTETKLLAHLPLLLHPQPKSFLAICFGMGTTVRSASRHPGLLVEAVDLVPQVYDCFPMFHPDARAIMADPRIRLHADDGRNFLAVQDRRWDVITLDPPPPPWSAGCVNLLSREFFELCKARLTEDGILCVWVMPMAWPDGRMVLATFRDVFPDVHVYRGPRYPGLYLVGTRSGKPLDTRRFQALAKDPALVADLNEYNNVVPDPAAIPDLALLGPKQMQAFTRGVPRITDDHPYTEFPLWRSRQDPFYNLQLNASNVLLWRGLVYNR